MAGDLSPIAAESVGAENQIMALMSCYACEARFDRLTRRCPNCGTYVLIDRVPPQPEPVDPPQLQLVEAIQETEPFSPIRPASPPPPPPPLPAPIPITRRRRSIVPLVGLVLIGVAIAAYVQSTRPTSSARNDLAAPTQSLVEPTTALTEQFQPTPTNPAPTEEPTQVPTATATSQPTTATATAIPSPSPTSIPPTPTPRPVVSTDEVVDNGGFEEGVSPWYLEDGARPAGINVHDGQRSLILPASGGYANQAIDLVPGGTYQLTAWAMVGAKGDSAKIGLRFLDGNGQRMIDLEPQPLEFTEQSYTRLERVFTVPPDAAEAHIVVWKTTGAGIVAVDAVSITGVSST